MKKYKEPTPDDYLIIAKKVRSGEYFREAKSMYDQSVNDALSERYFYVFVSSIALLTMLIAFYAAQSLYPLTRTVPFIYASMDVVEDVPRMIKIREVTQTPSEAVLFFLGGNYTRQQEEYNINTLERNMNGLKNSSSPEVFAVYQRNMQPTNPNSPVVQYQRHSSRNIDIVSTRVISGSKPQLEVVFDATVIGAKSKKTTRYVAELTYEYSGIELDAKTDTVKPFTFLVTSYNSKATQDNP